MTEKTTVIDRPKAKSVVGEVQPEKDGRWELRLTIRTKMIGVGAMKAVFEVFHIEEQFAGQTETVLMVRDTKLPGRVADVEGEMSGSSVSLDLRVHNGPLKAYRFHCTGNVDADGNRYEGSWHAPCVPPGDCGCEGTRDDFVMVRLDD